MFTRNKIKKEVSSQSTTKQLEEYDSCDTPDDAHRWLSEIMIMQKTEELKNEIIRYRSKIAGVFPETDTISAEVNISGLKPWGRYLIEEDDD